MLPVLGSNPTEPPPHYNYIGGQLKGEATVSKTVRAHGSDPWYVGSIPTPLAKPSEKKSEGYFKIKGDTNEKQKTIT